MAYTKHAVFVPNLGGLRAREDVVALRNVFEPTETEGHVQLTQPEFLRNVTHSQVALPHCWVKGTSEVRVLVGYQAFNTGELFERKTPVVAMWDSQCKCAQVWMGQRDQHDHFQHPDELMREVLAQVPRFLTVRERLDLMAGHPIQLMIVGEYDWHRYVLERLFRELTLPTEVRVNAVETGEEARAWVEAWLGAIRPVLLVRDRIRYDAGDLPSLDGSLTLLRNVALDAAAIGWDPGEAPSPAEVPMRDAGYLQFWDRRMPLDALMDMILDVCRVTASVQGVLPTLYRFRPREGDNKRAPSRGSLIYGRVLGLGD